MKAKLTRCLILIFVGLTFLSGCQPPPTSSQDTMQAYNVEFESTELKTYIDLYKTQVFYMEIGERQANFYLYDFETGKTSKVYSLSNFALKGTSNALIGSTLYFYISVYQGETLKNVLYALDYSKQRMNPVTENTYVQKLIPIIPFNNQILSLQATVSENGAVSSFLEQIDKNGTTTPVELKKAATATNQTIQAQNYIYVDNNDSYLYAIERINTDEKTSYHLCQFDSNFSLLKKIDITNLFETYEISESIGTFNCFEDYFTITDYSNNTIVFKVTGEQIEVLLFEPELAYVENACRNLPYALFYKRSSNDIYRLDIESKNIQIQNYDLNNDSSHVRCILSYENYILIVKKTINEEHHSEQLYLIPQKE